MSSRNVLLCLADGDVSKTKQPLEFWKEVARVGKFQKGDFKFSITEKSIDHWVKTHQQRARRGIECPLPVEHTKDPEKRRGTVLELAKAPNSKGETAMFARIKFRDKDAAKLVSSSVSIFVPTEDSDGYGNKYVAPVQHVALTDYPVIAGLEPWKPIACSMNDWSLAFPPQPDKQAADSARPGAASPVGPGAGSSNAGTTPSQGQNGKPKQPNDPGAPSPKPGDQGQAGQRVTLRDVANTLGIDPNITDDAQLLLAIQQTIMAMRSGQHMQQAPQPAVARPPMAPMAPAPGVAPMMPRPQVYQQRPPIAMAFNSARHPRKNKGEKGGGQFTDVGDHSGHAQIGDRVKVKGHMQGGGKIGEIVDKPSSAGFVVVRGKGLDGIYHDSDLLYHKDTEAAYVHKRERGSLALSLEDVPENILMALSKKQMKKLVKAVKKGKGKKVKPALGSAEFNDESHFGQECIGDSDEDDTFKDEGNDAFDSGEDNMDDNEDTLSGRGSRDRTLALSGSSLEVVQENRQMKIDALFSAGHITPVTKKRLEDRFVRGQGVAFSHQYDDGFRDVVDDLVANGRVLNVRGKTGPQTEGIVALSNGAEGQSSPLQVDAERRANGKPNFAN